MSNPINSLPIYSSAVNTFKAWRSVLAGLKLISYKDFGKIDGSSIIAWNKNLKKYVPTIGRIINCGRSTGDVDVYDLSPVLPVDNLVDDMVFMFTAHQDNVSTVNVSVSGGTEYDLVRLDGTQLEANDIFTNGTYFIYFASGEFQLINPASGFAIDDGPYNATTWNGSEKLATRNQIRDKIEALLTAQAVVDAAQDAAIADIQNGYTFTGDVLVPDEAYDATGWNSDLSVPTKNAVRDKLNSSSPSRYQGTASVTNTTSTTPAALATASSVVVAAGDVVKISATGNFSASDIGGFIGFTLRRDSTTISSATRFQKFFDANTGGDSAIITLDTTDVPAAGTYSYSLYWHRNGGTTIYSANCEINVVVSKAF